MDSRCPRQTPQSQGEFGTPTKRPSVGFSCCHFFQKGESSFPSLLPEKISSPPKQALAAGRGSRHTMDDSERDNNAAAANNDSMASLLVGGADVSRSAVSLRSACHAPVSDDRALDAFACSAQSLLSQSMRVRLVLPHSYSPPTGKLRVDMWLKAEEAAARPSARSRARTAISQKTSTERRGSRRELEGMSSSQPQRPNRMHH